MRNRFFRSALIAGCGFVLAGPLSAQTFSVLTVFGTNGINTGGSQAGLVFSGNALYGTALWGGAADGGTVFAVNTNGTGFTNLRQFTWVSTSPFPGGPTANDHGAFPRAGLVLSGDILYGITQYGGLFGGGAIFRMNKDGSGFTNLHSLANNEGIGARAGLLLSDNRLYGAGEVGGNFGRGALFAVNIDGTGFTNLHHFNQTNGAQPSGTLVVSDGILYGTAFSGGALDAGTVFKINTDGTGFTTLHEFIGGSTTNGGGRPFAGLVVSGEVLYGVTTYAGINDAGTIFRINMDGTGFRNLHRFQGIDGANAQASLLLRGNTLFGSTWRGGSNNNGIIFAIQTDGSGFTSLHGFAGPFNPVGNVYNSDGVTPFTDLILVGNTLYGTTQRGGSVDYGTVFSISLPIPQLRIVSSGTNMVLTWPANSPGFTLESSTSPTADDWSPVLPAPTVINGQHAVTNPISGPRTFYRLSL